MVALQLLVLHKELMYNTRIQALLLIASTNVLNY